MNLLKKRILPIALIFCLMFAFASCGSDDSKDSPTNDDNVSTSMDKDEYLDKVDGLNGFAQDFVKAGSDFITAAATNADDEDALKDAIEKIRETKKGFLEFSEISNPPEGYEDAHKDLAENAGKFGDLVEQYCNVLLASINGETDPNEATIQNDIEEVVNNLSTSMTAVQKIG